MNKKLKPANPTIHFDHPSRLDHYLSRFSSNSCSDRHDYIYAYLGLMSFDSASIRPDYKKSVVDVYTEATRAMITESRDLLAVCLTRRCGRPLEELPKDLPSWVTDWSSPFVCDQLVDGDEDVQTFYANGGTTVTDCTVSALSGPEKNILYLDGAVVDRIQSVSTGITTNDHDWEERVRSWVPKDLGQQPYTHLDGSEHDAVDVFWKTLLKYHEHTSYKQIRPGRRWHVKYYCYLFMKWAGLQLSQSDIENGEKSASPRKGNDDEAVWIERDFTQCIQGFLPGWALCTTSMDMWALVPFDAEKGDVIVVARGAYVPLVLRPVEGGGYRLVGTSYMYGLMQRQMMDLTEGGKVAEQKFKLY